MLPFRNAKEPAAMLIKAIREDWSAPVAYVAKKREEAERKAKAEAEALAEERKRHWQSRMDEVKAMLPSEELEGIIKTAREKVSMNLGGVFHGGIPEQLVNTEVNKIIASKYLNHAN